ncbi:MAG: hypothetical protein JSS70_14115 [Bacteroidetes bacterium]|nr:hypothetical protein [Bacteroidota bacterium]
MKTFCTIITSDFLPKAIVLFRSLQSFDQKVKLQVLVVDSKDIDSKNIDESLTIFSITQLSEYPLVKALYKKYAHINLDEFRWSLKPVFSSYLLLSGYDKIIYVDCDMFFVNDYNFLFDELDNNDIILTPHWNSTNPLDNPHAFLSNFTSGMFSAGFFGVTKNGLNAMTWWANACHFMMGEHIENGVNDDQRYLDLFPVLFEKMKIIRHRGCNIGSWNYEESKRVLLNGQVFINEKYPVIFIHFDEMLVSTILKGHDQLLLPYLDQYSLAFESEEYQLDQFLHSYKKYKYPGIFMKLKWGLRIKTRIKKWFYKIAESL